MSDDDGTYFDGETYEPERDLKRLKSQLDRVRNLMMDGEWHTLGEIASAVGGAEAAVSARLRDLRKKRFGAHDVERRYLHSGLWTYRMLLGP